MHVYHPLGVCNLKAAEVAVMFLSIKWLKLSWTQRAYEPAAARHTNIQDLILSNDFNDRQVVTLVNKKGNKKATAHSAKASTGRSVSTAVSNKDKAPHHIRHGGQVSLPVHVCGWRRNPDCINVEVSPFGTVEQRDAGRICDVCAYVCSVRWMTPVLCCLCMRKCMMLQGGTLMMPRWNELLWLIVHCGWI